MPKNIVICCDGTANEFAKHNTNVVKLYSTLERAPGRQIASYHPGLGTMEPAGALTTFARKLTKLLGLAIGYGLEQDIRDAYVFLMNNYEEGDRVFLFGFSRGAYTVRAVASMLHLYGLIAPGHEPLVPYIIRMMMAIHRRRRDDAAQEKIVDAYFELARDFHEAMSRPCKPWFVGVWDTVSSIGWVENPLKLPFVTNNPDIAIGRHAIAIDERRAFFRNHLWRPPDDPGAAVGPRDVRQVWFAGVHCDVGGGRGRGCGTAGRRGALPRGPRRVGWTLRQAGSARPGARVPHRVVEPRRAHSEAALRPSDEDPRPAHEPASPPDDPAAVAGALLGPGARP
jgi:uncharacterized protein (DUF2235 family)